MDFSQIDEDLAGLKEIRKGIYSIDGFPRKTRGNLVLAVHPFFWGFELNAYFDYTFRMFKFFKKRKGPIITLEEHTIPLIQKIAPDKNRFTVRTKTFNPDPIDTSWDSLAEFLNEYRGNHPVTCIGGFYSQDKSDPGCLDYTIRQIEEREIPTELKKDLVFYKKG